MNSKKILYICYDGMCEPLGQSQVLSYLARISQNWEVHLLSFEKPDDIVNKEKMSQVAEICSQKGIQWTALRYHSRPSLVATAYDIFLAWKFILTFKQRDSLALVHCRSYVATLMGMPAKWLYKKALIFDMRGFWADEKIDAQPWSKGPLYSFVKSLERYYLKKADHIISLTQKAIDEILSWPTSKALSPKKFSVISTCVETERFIWNEKGPGQLTLGYVGGAQLWYDFPRVLGLFNAILKVRPQSKLHIVNKSEHEYIKKCIQFAKIPEDAVTLEERSHSEMASVYSEFSFGVFFIRDFYSKKASMPTKLAEFMATGTPVITGRGIGDVDLYLEKYDAGVLMDLDLCDADMRRINELANDLEVRKRCRSMAENEFNLKKAISKLDEVYRHLASQA